MGAAAEHIRELVYSYTSDYIYEVGFKARQGAHSPDYATLAATQKPGPETSKMG